MGPEPCVPSPQTRRPTMSLPRDSLATDLRRHEGRHSQIWKRNSELVDGSLLGQKATRIHHRLQFQFRKQGRQIFTVRHSRFCIGSFLAQRTSLCIPRWRCTRGASSGCTEDGEHELIVVDLDPSILRAANKVVNQGLGSESNTLRVSPCRCLSSGTPQSIV